LQQQIYACAQNAGVLVLYLRESMIWPRGAQTEVLMLTMPLGAGIHKKPLVRLIKHALTTLAALVVAPLSNLITPGPSPPVDPSSITPEWLTWMLRQQELLTAEQHVTSVSVMEFEAGKTGRSGRVVMTYNTDSAVAPPSVVVKMSRVDFRGRFLNLALYLSREAHFFAQLGGARSCPTCLLDLSARLLSQPLCYLVHRRKPDGHSEVLVHIRELVLERVHHRDGRCSPFARADKQRRD
jgi:hypothetical protein